MLLAWLKSCDIFLFRQASSKETSHNYFFAVPASLETSHNYFFAAQAPALEVPLRIPSGDEVIPVESGQREASHELFFGLPRNVNYDSSRSRWSQAARRRVMINFSWTRQILFNGS